MADTTSVTYRDPRCRIAPSFPDHVCSRRDRRPLAEPGEECYLGHQRPSLLDEAQAERVVDAVADGLLRRTEAALGAFFWAEVADAQRLEQMAAEAAFYDWLAGGDPS